MIITRPYQRERAVEYARTWALSRNPLFVDFTGRGGNCTNFVSQCVLAGSCVMNDTPDFGWYYISDADRAPAWSSVEYFYDFMTGIPSFAARNGGIGPFATEVAQRDALPGDAVQFADAEGDWYHTVIISSVENGEIYVCAQSDDALDRPLSSYRFASARFLHMEGVHEEVVDMPDCFAYLLSGGTVAVPPEQELPLPPTDTSPEVAVPEELPPEPMPSVELPSNDRPDVIEGS